MRAMGVVLDAMFAVFFSSVKLPTCAPSPTSDCGRMCAKGPRRAPRPTVESTIRPRTGASSRRSMIAPPEAGRRREDGGPSLPPTDLIDRAHDHGLLIHTWTFRDEPGNTFEPVVERRHPKLAEIRARLLKAGAEMARLAGSGSCVFGRNVLQSRFSDPRHGAIVVHVSLHWRHVESRGHDSDRRGAGSSWRVSVLGRGD